VFNVLYTGGGAPRKENHTVLASVMLANFAKVSDNMLDVQQAGWSMIGPGPVSFYVAGIVSCQWHETNAKHNFKIEVLDADGQPFPHPESGEPVRVEATFEIGRPPGIKAGSNIGMPFAVPFGAFIFEPSAQYEIKFSLDGEDRDEWRLPFVIRDAPADQLAA
jgi:hypothetical protein